MSNERIAAEEEGSVTRWLGELKEGESEATRQLWNRYFNDLVRLARSRLWNVSRAAADEEDAALDAFDSFRRGVEKGRFPKLDDREDLWRILVTITACKAADLAKFEQALKRNPSGGVRNEADLNADALERGGLGALPSGDPNPETEAKVKKVLRQAVLGANKFNRFSRHRGGFSGVDW